METTNVMIKSILTILFSFLFIVSGFSQTRNVVVDTNGIVVQPTNIWTANVTNARSGLGLGTAATNSASAFQPSSSVLSNLASSNGLDITNIQATNLVGIIPASNIATINISNITGIISIASGGTGATNAANARTNLGLGATNNVIFRDVQAISFLVGDETNSAIYFEGNSAAVTRTNLGLGATWLTNTNVTNFRTAVELGATNSVKFQSVTAGVIYANEFGSTNYGVMFDIDETNTINVQKALGFPTNIAADTRANLGLGWSALTNTSATNFRSDIGLGVTNTPIFSNIQIQAFSGGNSRGFLVRTEGQTLGVAGTNVSTATPAFYGWGGFFSTAFSADEARTNLGLGWPALTNTNSGTSLVSVNSNGSVVSPTNFWQVAPINTRVQYSQPVVNATNAATNARNLYLYSLAISTVGVTNTITLPTNSATFYGDVATVIHEGPTNSFTAIRQIGSATNIISLNQLQEAVQFIYNGDGWKLADNISYTEPIYFSGTNAAVHAAESRTNLGIPLAALTNTNNQKFQEAIFSTNAPTNAANFGDRVTWLEVFVLTNGVTNSFKIPLYK